MKKAIVFDLDWTLCKESATRPEEYTGSEEAIDCMYSLYLWYSGYSRIIITGRKERHRATTELWLKNNAYQFDTLIMNDDGVGKKNHILKREKLIELQKEYDIELMIDNNPDIAPVCAELGINFMLFTAKK